MSTSGHTDPSAPHRSRWLALGVISTSTLMTVLDGSIVTVAMPAIQDDLGFSATGLSWVVNAYLIAFGGLLLLAGRLGDLLGRRRVFLAGTALFTAASLAAALARDPGTLVAARFVQGAGSAAAGAVALGILVTLFPEPRERARAIAVFAFTGAAGASTGQVLGGVLTDAASWHWIFLVNLPIGIATIALATRSVPADRGRGRGRDVDAAGAVLVTGGLMLAIGAVVGAEAHGWASARTLGLGAAGLALLAGFAVRQATAAQPLVPPRVVRERRVAGANIVQILMVAALFAFQVLVAVYLQRVRGYGAAGTGLAMLPAALAIGTVSLGVSARLIPRLGERAVLLTGLGLLVAMFALLVRLPVDANYTTDILPVMLLASGVGLAQPALTALAMSAADERDAGLASGVFNTTQQIGMALGVALLSTLAAARTDALGAAGRTPEQALTGGYHLAFTVGAGLLLAAFAVALVMLRPARAAEGVTGSVRGSVRGSVSESVSGPVSGDVAGSVTGTVTGGAAGGVAGAGDAAQDGEGARPSMEAAAADRERAGA